MLCLFEPQVKELLDMPDDAATVAHIAVGHATAPDETGPMGLDESFSPSRGARQRT